MIIHEVKNALENVNIYTKSAGHDILPSQILSLMANELTPSLRSILNISIEQGPWRSDFKRGGWVPAYQI